jgi:hypothetical protein
MLTSDGGICTAVHTHFARKHHSVGYLVRKVELRSYVTAAFCMGMRCRATWSTAWSWRTVSNSCRLASQCTFHVHSRHVSRRNWTVYGWRQALTLKELAEHTGISGCTVIRILRPDLKMPKTAARNVQNLLKMPSSYMIMPQPTQQILLSAYSGVGSGKCCSTLFILPTSVHVTTLWFTNWNSRCLGEALKQRRHFDGSSAPGDIDQCGRHWRRCSQPGVCFEGF